MLLAACAPQPPRPDFIGGQGLAPEPPRARVALLLPMSGSNAPLGAAMLNAAQLALFEQGNRDVEFVTQDTGGTPAGAARAARAAIADGSRIIAGPLTAAETAAAAVPARAARLPMLAMTNDAAQATAGVWPLGVTPAQQVRRIVEVGMAQGIRRFALAGPQGAFSQQLALALRSAASQAGLPQPAIVLYPASASPMLAARDLAGQLGTPPAAEEGPLGLILAEAGDRARAFAGALAGAGLPSPPLRLLGTASWGQDAVVAAEPSLADALYPGADAGPRISFEARYRAAFGELPPRIAAIAYDAANIAAQSVRGNGRNGASAEVPVGAVFQGADGSLRLLPDGTVQRALAVYAVTPGGPARLVEPAALPAAGS